MGLHDPTVCVSEATREVGVIGVRVGVIDIRAGDAVNHVHHPMLDIG